MDIFYYAFVMVILLQKFSIKKDHLFLKIKISINPIYVEKACMSKNPTVNLCSQFYVYQNISRSGEENQIKIKTKPELKSCFKVTEKLLKLMKQTHFLL